MTKYLPSVDDGYPSNWKVVKLAELGTFLKGAGISKSELIENGLPCIRYGEIYTTHDYIIKKFFSFISPDVAANSKQIYTGDILFTGSGETTEEIGKCVSYIGNEIAYAGGDIIILRLNNGDPKFLGYLLNHEITNRQKIRLGQGYSIVHINSSHLREIVVPFPPLPEQRKIAEILSIWDEAIDITGKIISSLQARKQGLVQRLLTGQVRIPGHEGEWMEVKLSQILRVRKEKGTQSQGLELFSLTIENGVTPKTDRYNREFLVRSNDKSYKKVYPDDIVYNPSNLRWGAIGRSRQQKVVLVSPIYEVLQIINPEKFNIDYLFPLLCSPDQIRRFSQMGEGTLFERIAVKVDSFLSVKVPAPPTQKEQAEIANILRICDQELEIVQNLNKALQQQKRGLMQYLLYGVVRVKVE